MMNTSGKSPCRIYRHIWIVSIYIHAKMCCSICHKHTDCSKTDNSKFLSLQFLSSKCFFRLFGIFGYVSILFILLHPVDAANDISGCQQHTGDYQFFYSICISSRCIKYNNSLFRTFLKRDIIHTCTGSCDCFQICCKFHFVHCRTSYQDRISRLRCAYRCIVFCKFIQSYL